MNKLSKLLELKKTVFNYADFRHVFPGIKDDNLRKYLLKAKENGILLNPLRWYRALPNYDPKELACLIKQNGYISCQTVLFREGVIFQFMGNTLECVADRHVEYVIDNQNFKFYKIKPELLNNNIGIRDYENYRMATLERALCDYIYFFPKAGIDAPENINKIRLKQILPYYPKSTVLSINKLLNVEY